MELVRCLRYSASCFYLTKPQVVLGSRLPRFVHWIATKVIKHLLKDSLFADCFGERVSRGSTNRRRSAQLAPAQSRPKSVHELWYWTEQRDLYADAFRQQVRQCCR
jgi:hypothetical protein